MFRSLSLRGRFLVAPFIGVILTLVLYFSANAIFRSHSDLFQQLSNINLPRISEISRLTLLLTNNHTKLSEVLLQVIDEPDEEKVYISGRQILNDYYKIEAEFNQAFDVVNSTETQQNDVVEKIRIELVQYKGVIIDSIEISTVSANLARRELLLANGILQQLNELLLELSEYYVHRLEAESEFIDKSIYDHKIITFLTFILISLMVFSAIYFSNRMSFDMEKINRSLIRLSKGRTDVVLPAKPDRYLQPLSDAVLAFKATQKALQQNEAQLRAILQYSPTLISTKDLKGNVTLVNRQFDVLAGFENDNFVGKNIFDLFPYEIANALWENDKAAREGPMEFEEQVQHKDGSLHTYLTIKFPLTDDSQRLTGTCAISADITQRKESELKLIENEEKFRAVFQSSVVAMILITGKDGAVLEWNKGAEKIFGYTSEEVMGKPVTVIIPENLRAGHDQGIAKAMDNGGLVHGGISHELTGLRKNKQIFQMELTLSSWFLNGEQYFSAIVLDITVRKEQEQKIIHQAHYDALTNLPNRFLSLNRLAHLIKESQRRDEFVAVLFLDLDDFKKVNDSLGHEAGDALLVEAGKRLMGVVRQGDTVGRLGGDEYIILLSGLSHIADATPVVKNLINQLRRPFEVDNRELILTASVGISVYPGDGENASELLRNADSAMYNSKELGRNTYSFYTDEMNQRVSRRLSIEEQMNGAIERNEFNILFQPQIDIRTNRITGVEALIRWNNLTLGDVLPDEFIPIAEQTGLIIPIGQFVLTQALILAKQWQQISNFTFQIAVNLSPRQFRDPSLVDFVESSIKQSGVTASSLELEITEGVLMSGHAYIDEALASLDRMGVELSMDDFGTGYSSLSYLRKYPFSTLKIDRSFISDITTNSADKTLVDATIAMAHSLGLKVIAEGVETEEQLLHLKTQGCEFAQGYFFSKPVSSEEITKMLMGQT